MTVSGEPTDAEATSRIDALQAVRGDGDEGATPGRRSVLRGAVAGLAASVGLSGTAAALDPTPRYALRRIGARYDAPTARDAFRTRGAELLDLLAERGHVDDVEALAEDLETHAVHSAGTPTARIEATGELDDGQVKVAVEPETDRAYAFVDTGEGRTILDPSVEGNEVDTSNCILGPACMATETACDSDCLTWDVECCPDDCFLEAAKDCCSGTCYSDCKFVCE